MPPVLPSEVYHTPATAGDCICAAKLIIAASVGAAIALFATGKLPSELNKTLGLNAETMTLASKPAGDTKITREQPGLDPPSRPLRR
jgi:hypothetical protein